MTTSHTPGPWRWQGEDYRGGWGWQLLVGPSGEGILCGQSPNGPYEKLRAFVPISPEFCKTGMVAPAGSAPCVHVLQADAALIAAAPDMFAALKEIASVSEFATSCIGWVVNKAKYAIENATGVSINNMTNFTDRERDLMRQVELAHIDLNESDALRDKMDSILSRSVNAIRGEPAPLHRHSWHDLPELIDGLKVDLLTALLDKKKQADLVETCIEAMNTNADAGQKAEQEIQRLQGEAKVMRGVLTECAGVILAIDGESESEADMLDVLHEKIVLAIRGNRMTTAKQIANNADATGTTCQKDTQKPNPCDTCNADYTNSIPRIIRCMSCLVREDGTHSNWRSNK